MQIRLNDLRLENFKGIRDFTLSPQGQDVSIHGANGTGKTTLADAVAWLLFDKDTRDRKDFGIKTLDAAGMEIPAIDHTVGATLEIDGRLLVLAKTLKEKWTKKRRGPQKTLTGHTTEHAIDGVPIQKKDWDQRMADLINEEIFKLVTSPGHFNSLHWEQRRKILLDVCGDISDTEVIASSGDLADLPDILGNRTLDETRAVVKARKKALNKYLAEIPARIDELTKSLPQTLPDKNVIQSQINVLSQKIQDAQDDTELSKLRKELADTQATLAEKRAEHIKQHQEANAKINEEILDREIKIRGLQGDIKTTRFDIESAQATIKTNLLKMDDLRSQYSAMAAKSAPDEEICPTCGQSLPPTQIEAARSAFRARQAEKLTEINAGGKALKYDNEKLGKIYKTNELKIAGLKAEINGLKKDIETLNGEITVPGIPIEIQKLEGHVRFLQTAITDRPKVDTSALKIELMRLQDDKATIINAEKTKRRIEELKDEEKKLSAEFEELERQLYLMEKFVVKKVGLLEFQINSKFKLAKFKLFKTLINGGIEECCETLYNGVPYGPGLSTGEKIYIGCDILSTLQGHFGISAPVWLDHAESLTYPIDLDCQVVRLFVDEGCKELTIK